ncbi:unnamed protein product [Ostreobium quekettii]|uniref:EamA domain-containing protein n=1 Tax=Ostreobium quekettii TaxID=121088 RepID=A0A8S1JBE7_9CHLO|nr:unnamed protein product [Ostreobium quekettii]|eukprot:evm.model.scf_67.8 EVM.evm.TU.scf_67.8   scf_67:126766-127725(+)
MCCAMASTSMWFATDCVVRTLEWDVPVLENVFLRSALSIPTLLLASWLLGIKPILGHLKSAPFLLLRGLVGSITWISVFGALLLIPMGDALALLFASNAVVAVTARLLRLDQRFRWFSYLGVACSLLGIIFITRPPLIFGGEGDLTPKRKLGIFLGLLACFGVTTLFLVVRFIGKSEAPITITLYLPMVAIVISGVPLAFGFPQAIVWNVRPFDMGLIVLYTLLSIIAQLLNARAMQLSSATLTSTINSLELVLGRVGDVLIFHTVGVTALAMVGTGLMFVGAVTVALGGGRGKEGVERSAASRRDSGSRAGEAWREAP